MKDFVMVTSVYPAIMIGVVPTSGVTEPSLTEGVEPVMEATPIF